jgi:hypothetical protein
VPGDSRARSVAPGHDAAVSPFGYEIVFRAESLEYIVDRVLLQDRLTAMFATFFGAIALLLAAVGVYGLMSFEVSQRLREMAIRLALGAERRDLLKHVVGDGVGITVVGLTVGALLALSSVGVLRSFIFGVTPYGATTLVAAVAILPAIATLACVLPALRASRADPTSILGRPDLLLRREPDGDRADVEHRELEPPDLGHADVDQGVGAGPARAGLHLRQRHIQRERPVPRTMPLVVVVDHAEIDVRPVRLPLGEDLHLTGLGFRRLRMLLLRGKRDSLLGRAGPGRDDRRAAHDEQPRGLVDHR